jgi:methylaspartate mutase epsilon subunit
MTNTSADTILQISTAYIKQLNKQPLSRLLDTAKRDRRLLYQPRCGVGDHQKMKDLLGRLHVLAKPEVLSLTIDSHTRLKDFSTAKHILATAPDKLNGYPLVAQGWRRGRDLNESVAVPLQIRHGSPDPRRLFNMAILSGITAFEGGPISYNLPYCKNVPLIQSLKAWEYVDRLSGAMAQEGIIVDRELFGTLTAVLIPPSISLAISTLEALLSAAQGVRCISIAYPQGGQIVQDVAALRCIPLLAEKYLSTEVKVYAVLHEYMGPFPLDSVAADALIFYGGLTAKLGNATKIVTKTNHEAHGIPTVEANAGGISTARMAESSIFGFIELPEAQIQEEMDLILTEVDQLVAPILQNSDLQEGIIRAFEHGRLDIPFCASLQARSEVIPLRDHLGFIRYAETGQLPFSAQIKRRNKDVLNAATIKTADYATLMDSINYFANGNVAQHNF